MVKLVVPPVREWAAAQPHADWAAARAHAAVVPLESADGSQAGSADSPRAVAITRFAAAERVLRDSETFSSGRYEQVHGEFKGVTLRALDGVAHRRQRALIAPSLRPALLERWEREIVRPVAHRLLDAIAKADRADLVAAYTARLPVGVICAILGLPPSDHERFMAWSEAVNSGPHDPAAGRVASREMAEYFRPLISARRARPQPDLLSALVEARVEGGGLDEAQLLGFLRLLLPAGAETTYRVLGSALYALLTHPAALARVRADPSMMPAVVEETLRWETSVTMTTRHTAREVELEGVSLPAGSALTVVLSSANRDESRWSKPEVWDPMRPRLPHLAFGSGPHICPGLHLARLEIRVGLELALQRLPRLRLDPEAPAPSIQGYAFRGPNRLPVRWGEGRQGP